MTARVFDLSEGGVFIETDNPMPAKKRVSLEIQVTGELAPWAALGRIVWVRAARSADQKPPGMGVAFIDVDEAVLAAIRRLVARHPAESAAGGAEVAPAAPAREKTVLGVGPAASAAVPAAPIVAAAPAREKTVLGVGSGPPPTPGQDPVPTAQRDAAPPAVKESLPVVLDKLPRDLEEEAAWEAEDAPPAPVPAPAAPPRQVEAAGLSAREQSVAIDLVAKRPSGAPATADTDREASLRPAGVPRRGGGARLLFLLLLASGAGAGYAFRDRLRPLIAPYVHKSAWMAPVEPAAPVAAPVTGPATSASQADMATAPAAASASAAGAASASTRRAETASTAAPSAVRAPSPGGAVPSAAPAPAASASAAKAQPRRPASPGPKPAPAVASPPATDNPDNPY